MTVTVWLIDWRNLSSAQANTLTALLTAEERTRADSFHFANDRSRFSLGRGLLRFLSAQALGVPPSRLHLETERRGKPYWAGYRKDLEVNVSHSGKWISLALGPTAPVGIDVQEQRENVDMAGITRLSMHPEEQAWFANQTGVLDAFYALWTLREAALKATGDGFFAARTDLNTLPVPNDGDWARRAYGDGITLDLRPISAANGYACAVASVVTPDASAAPKIDIRFRDALTF